MQSIPYYILILLILDVPQSVRCQNFKKLGRHQIIPNSALFWNPSAANEQRNSEQGQNLGGEQSNGFVSVDVSSPDNIVPPAVNPNQQSDTVNEESNTPPQSSGFWPDSKFVFKRRKNTKTDNTESGVELNQTNPVEQTRDNTDKHAIFIHYSGADRYKFTGKSEDVLPPSTESSNQNLIISSTENIVAVSLKPLDFETFPNNNQQSINSNTAESQLTEAETLEIKKELAEGFLGLKSIKPILQTLIQPDRNTNLYNPYNPFRTLPIPREELTV